VEKLRRLEGFPETELDIVKVAGEENTFRLRVGNYRVLFKVYEKERIIVIAKIDTRKGFIVKQARATTLPRNRKKNIQTYIQIYRLKSGFRE